EKLVKPLLQSLLGTKEQEGYGATMNYDGALNGTPVSARQLPWARCADDLRGVDSRSRVFANVFATRMRMLMDASKCMLSRLYGFHSSSIQFDDCRIAFVLQPSNFTFLDAYLGISRSVVIRTSSSTVA